MPKLQTYNNSADPNAGPLVTQARDQAQMGYYRGQAFEGGIRELGRGIDAQYSYYEKKKKAEEDLKASNEISNLSIGLAMTEADLAVKWDRYKADGDPSDPDLYTKFIEEYVNPAYDELGGRATTEKAKEYYTVHKAKAWATTYKTTAGDTAVLNGKAAVDKLTQVGTSYTNAAYFDPTNWKHHVEQSDGAIDAVGGSHNLNKTQLHDLKTSQTKQIAVAAIDGMIKQNPALAKEALESGEFSTVLSGKEVGAALAKAESRIKSREKDATAEETAANKKLKAEGNQALAELQGTVDIDPSTGKHTLPPDFFENVDTLADKYGAVLGPAPFRAVKNWATVELRRTDKMAEGASDPTVRSTIRQKAMDKTLTMDEIFDARSQNLISSKDFDLFKGWVTANGKGEKAGPSSPQQKRVDGIIKSYKGYINDSLNDVNVDSWGKSRYTEFEQDMDQAWEEMKAAGKTEEDFQEYVAKALPNYVFSKDEVKKMMKDSRGAVVIPDRVDAPDWEAPPSKSMDDFLKETGAMGKQSSLDLGQGEVDYSAFLQASYSPDGKDYSEAVRSGRAMPLLHGNPMKSLLGKNKPGRQPVNMDNLNPVVVDKMERLQGVLGFQIPVVSAYRDPAVNKKAGGAKKSQHVQGNALDLDVAGMSVQERIRVIEVASALGFTGIGVYANSIHLDVGGRRAWGPSHSSDSIPGWAAGVIKAHNRGRFLTGDGVEA